MNSREDNNNNDNEDDDDASADTDASETLHLLDSSFAGFGYQKHEDSKCFKMLSLFYSDSDYDTNEDDASRQNRVVEQCERIWGLQQLEKLQLHHFLHPILPRGIGNLTTLKHLDIVGAQRLTAIPTDIGLLLNLVYLAIEGCPSLEALPDEIGDLTSLKELQIQSLPNLQTIPTTIGRLQNLQELGIIDCDSLSSLPEDIGRLRELKKMYLSSLGGLHSLPINFGSGLKNLEYLSVYECRQLTTLESVNWQAMQNVTTICITGCQSLTALPMEIKQAKRMKALNLSGTPSNALLQLFAVPWNIGGSLPSRIHLSAEHPQHPERQRPLGDFQLGNDYGKILQGMPDSLEYLDLGYHGIEKLDGFLVPGLLPRGLRSLVLEGNPILSSDRDDDQIQLLKLLDASPQLGFVSSSYREHIITESTVYSLLLNRCGKILMVNNDNATPPLPIWPLVLENVHNRTFEGVQYADRILDTLKIMELSVIFSLLRGPALLGRLAEGHDLTWLHRKRKRRSSVGD